MEFKFYVIVLMFTIISSVHSRSLYNRESDIRTLKNYFLESPSYSDLLALFVNSKNPIHKKKDNTYQPRQFIAEKQEFLPRPTKPIGRRARLSSLYGRKSHWDTFFG